MEDVNTLQSKLTKIAEKKLSKDVEDFLENIKKSPFFDLLEFVTIKKEDNKQDNLRSALWNNSEYIGNLLISKSKDKYIERETQDFIKKVDNIQSQIDEVRDELDNKQDRERY